VKVWIATCTSYECSCVAIYDHAPGATELIEAGFCNRHGIPSCHVIETELDKVMNHMLTGMW
jgi:hypothetical protein